MSSKVQEEMQALIAELSDTHDETNGVAGWEMHRGSDVSKGIWYHFLGLSSQHFNGMNTFYHFGLNTITFASNNNSQTFPIDDLGEDAKAHFEYVRAENLKFIKKTLGNRLKKPS